MVIIGVDPHPDTHTVAALDPNGKQLASLKVSNDSKGLRQIWDWVQQFPERRWAIEGAGNRFLTPWIDHLHKNSEPS